MKNPNRFCCKNSKNEKSQQILL